MVLNFILFTLFYFHLVQFISSYFILFQYILFYFTYIRLHSKLTPTLPPPLD